MPMQKSSYDAQKKIVAGTIEKAETVYDDSDSLIISWEDSQLKKGIISLITTKNGEIHIDSENQPIGFVAEILKKWVESVRIGPFSIN
jgi:hypothetical protein